jgi:hypothetical protein
VSGPFAAAAVVASGRVSDANTGASSSTVTPPSTITAGGHFGGHSNASPQNAAQAAALSRLNSSEVRAVQALSGIHNDVLPYNSRTAGGHPATGFRQLAPQQQQQQQQQAPSPAAITETVAKELLCRASRVSAAAASSIAAVAAAAAAATAAKGSDGAAVMARSSADGSFSGLVGDMAATLGDGRLPAGAAAATPDALQTEQRLCTPRLSPLLTSSMLLPPPPPLQLQLEGAQDLGGDSLPGTATTAAAAAAAAAVAAGKPAGAGAEAAGAAAAAGKVLPHVDPGDAFAAEAGWGNSLEDLLMPKKRPSCSGNSGLIGLLGDIGQLKSEADAAAAAVVVVPEQQQQQQQEEGQDAAAAGDAAAAPAEQQAAAAADDATAEAPLATAAPSADAPAKAPAAATSAAADAAAAAQSSVPAAALPAAVSAALPDPAPSQSLSSASVAFITPQAEPMAVQP